MQWMGHEQGHLQLPWNRANLKAMVLRAGALMGGIRREVEEEVGERWVRATAEEQGQGRRFRGWSILGSHIYKPVAIR